MVREYSNQHIDNRCFLVRIWLEFSKKMVRLAVLQT
jgi:hypothetical protein